MLKKFKITLLVVLAINLINPPTASARVLINEIAWMGNDKGQYGEWIELYNDSNEVIDLKDATLNEAGGGTLIIKLTKSISAKGYYLVARSTPSVPDPVSGLADDLGSFGGSGLSNSGEYLILKSADETILDSLDMSSGWSAGDSADKLTMQKSENTWITATGTPRTVNTIITNTNTDEVTDISETVSVENISGNEPTGLSAHSSPADLSNTIPEVKISASAGRNRLVLVGAPIIFEEKLYTDKNEVIDGGNVSWSFGDGQTATGKIITHTYKFPGDYAVIMNVHRNADDYVARTNVRVVHPDIAIAEVVSEYIKIKNRSIYEANLGEWRVDSGQALFVFPRDTIIKEKGEMILGRDTAGLVSDAGVIKLLSPVGKIISSFEIKKEELVKSDNLPSVDNVREDSITIDKDSIATVLLSELEQKLILAKNSLALLQANKTEKVSIPQGSISQDLTPEKESNVSKDTSLEELKVESDVQVIEKPKSIFRTLLNAPVNGFRYIKDLIF